jgi:5-methylcytosine-specific restriction endonuclease McrA
MVYREYRRDACTPQEEDRLQRCACPVCGRERKEFPKSHKSAKCCCREHSVEYWDHQRPTAAQLRKNILEEQGGLCARCKGKIDIYDHDHPFILDHIIPLAMGGSQWDRENLQDLCYKCNLWKTKKDLGRIARYKRLKERMAGTFTDLALDLTPEEKTRQTTLSL